VESTIYAVGQMTDASHSRLPPRERGRPLRLRDGNLPGTQGAPQGTPPSGDAEERPTRALRGPARARMWLLLGIRYVLPVLVTLCGVVIMAFGSETDLEGGASIVSAGLAIYFLNWLYRIGVSGDRERDTEEAARDYFSRHGRWPS
jgi:hypothetical protein